MTKKEILKKLENNEINVVIEALRKELNATKTGINQVKLVSLIKYIKKIAVDEKITPIDKLMYLDLSDKKYLITGSFIVMLSESVIEKLNIVDIDDEVKNSEYKFKRDELLKVKDSFTKVIESAKYDEINERHIPDLYNICEDEINNQDIKYRKENIPMKYRFYPVEVCSNKYFNGKVLKLLMESFTGTSRICVEEWNHFTPLTVYDENDEMLLFALPVRKNK